MQGGVRSIFILGLCLLECLLFGATLFGWPSLMYVYKDKGVLSHLCNSTKHISGNHSVSSSYLLSPHCPKQDSLLSLAFTVGAAVFGISGLPSGILFDKFGLRCVRTIAIFFGITGYLCLAFVSQGGLSYLIFPGAICLGITSPLIIMTNSHVAELAGSRSSLIIILFNGVNNSSGIVFFFVKLAYDKGFDFKWSLIIIACLWIIVIGTTFLLLPRKKIISLKIYPEPESLTEDESSVADSSVMIVERSRWSLIFTPQYLSHVIYFCTVNMCITLFIGTMNTWLGQVTNHDKNKVSMLTNIYAYLQFGIGMLVPPIAGVVTHQTSKSVAGGSGVVAAPGLFIASFCACSTYIFLLVSTSWSPYSVFFFNETCRSFFFGNATVYITQAFPLHVFGLLFGLMYAINGVALTAQYAYIQLSVISGYTPVAIVLLVTAVASLAHPTWLLIRHRRDPLLSGLTSETTYISTGDKASYRTIPQ